MGSFLLNYCSKSIVRIFRQNGKYAGTGFLIDDQGGILTTLYVAGKDKEFEIALSDNHKFDAFLEKADGISELSLLRSNNIQKMHLNIDEVEEIPSHEKVTIMGYAGNTPSKLEGTGAGTYTTDVLSPKKLVIQVNTSPSGLSGAPAINEHGRVIGVLVGFLPESGRVLSVSGKSAVGFLQNP